MVYEKVSDLVHDFMNFNAFKIILNFVYKLMQCLQQVEVPVGIDITAYDSGRSCQVRPDPKGESVSLGV